MEEKLFQEFDENDEDLKELTKIHKKLGEVEAIEIESCALEFR